MGFKRSEVRNPLAPTTRLAHSLSRCQGVRRAQTQPLNEGLVSSWTQRLIFRPSTASYVRRTAPPVVLRTRRPSTRPSSGCSTSTWGAGSCCSMTFGSPRRGLPLAAGAQGSDDFRSDEVVDRGRDVRTRKHLAISLHASTSGAPTEVHLALRSHPFAAPDASPHLGLGPFGMLRRGHSSRVDRELLGLV